jgi:hypothetical protein
VDRDRSDVSKENDDVANNTLVGLETIQYGAGGLPLEIRKCKCLYRCQLHS